MLGQESLETPACKFCNLLSGGEIPLHVLFYDSQVLMKFISYDLVPSTYSFHYPAALYHKFLSLASDGMWLLLVVAHD
jgi:hypothetical protein